jgi:hypothetical protein
MQLRIALFCSFLALPALAACGDDSGGGGAGGDGSTSGASTTTGASGTTTSTGANNTTTGGEGGEDPSGSTGSGGSDNTLSCDTYCETIMGACEDFPQFPDLDSCLRSCPSLEEGVYQEPGATLGCHQYHADAADADPATHCSHAGPQGGGQCGSSCENFCQLAVGVCPDVYASAEVCMKVCPDFAEGTFSVDPPATGDNLGCRLYHLSVAALSDDDAAIHCPHTAADSDQCL